MKVSENCSMILCFKITKEQKLALLSLYPSIKYFVEKAIINTAEKIIIDQDNFNVEEELAAYHNRRILNDYNPKKRKMTQATKNKISKTLKEKYRGTEHHLFEETKRLISIGNKGKIISQETRDKISKANKGKKRTEEQKRKMSLSRIGKKHKKREKVELS